MPPELNDELIGRVRSATAASELVRAAASIAADGGVEFALGRVPLRRLTAEEIRQLEVAGNSSPDWTCVRVADPFDPRRLRDCRLHRDIVLGRFRSIVPIAHNLEFPAGIERATLVNCVVGDEAFIHDVRLLANCVVGAGAVVFDCGAIECDRDTAFGNGQALSVGNESGGRDVAAFAEIDIEIARAVALERRRKESLQAYGKAVAEYTDKVRAQRTIICPGALIRSTPKVSNVYVGPHAQIDGATLVANSTLLSDCEEPAEISFGACVDGALVQWGSRVSTLACVHRSVLMEHSHVENHGSVRASLLGPNSGVGRGEVTSSLVGPFVNLHHESLLIATLWPEGKGNVSYGAMAGANHTSKSPDQEFMAGEGVFLGLGVKIRFPADLTEAPYTLVAAGVTTLPQKLLFPFSLINFPAETHAGVPPAYNEIFPAWFLTDNLYALRRNENKYRTRNRARRIRFEFRVLRPEIIDLISAACRRLEAVQAIKAIYTEQDIPGLGKNSLTEASRQRAIEGYRFGIRYYALLAMKSQIESLLESGRHAAVEQVLHEPANRTEWEHARRILSQQPDIPNVEKGLQLLMVLLEEAAQSVEKSKAKDDERGVRIIADYAETHQQAAQDPVVRQTWEEARRLQGEIRDLLRQLTSPLTTAGP